MEKVTSAKVIPTFERKSNFADTISSRDGSIAKEASCGPRKGAKHHSVRSSGQSFNFTNHNEGNT